ncbi:MAG: nucleotidyltransferase domain-containing protein [Myxococcales bacterium]|nr:nucleotidyltransferase domain-containing protein [Myxococcales bacterium]
MVEQVLSQAQLRVVREYLAARERERRHLVAYVSGAHAYGFASPDSDVDLKCIHVAATGDLVGLSPGSETADRIEIIEGVEVDYGSNELAGALRGAIKGNGNYLERFLGELVVSSMPELAEVRPIVTRLLSRRVARHYAGFAAGQLRLFEDKPTAKRALYVLRTSATGRHLLASGELVTDLRQLAAQYAPPQVEELFELKRSGEQSALAPEHAAAWRARLQEAIAQVDANLERSVLPEEPSARAAADAEEWLRGVRRHYW